MFTNTIELLGGIVLEGKLHKKVTIRELSGYEEDIFLSITDEIGNEVKGLTPALVGDKFLSILSRCTVAIGDVEYPHNLNPESATNALKGLYKTTLNGDNDYILIQLRVLSLGPDFSYSDICAGCKVEIPRITANLNDLDKYRYLSSYTNDEERDKELLSPTWVTKTPSGVSVAWSPLRHDGGIRLSEALSSKKDIPTRALMTRIVAIDGKPLDDEKALKKLSSKDRNWLNQHFDAQEGGVDTSLTIECPKCGLTLKRRINIASNTFFFPSAT